VIRKLGDEGGFSLVEMLVVMIIMGVIMGGIVKLFTAGINSNADLNRRYQAQQDGRLALDKLRREIHGACTISTPATYNTPVNSVTLYYPADLCVAGSPGSTVTYCTVFVAASPVGVNPNVIAHYSLYRKTGASCTGATQIVADFLTAANIFDYLPPNSHVTTLGSGAGGIATIDGGATLPRLHIDMTLTQNTAKNDSYHLVDDIALRNGPRVCPGATASC
jgi:prepilin-type N-terminal cleavage/methylation domain-containing protein